MRSFVGVSAFSLALAAASVSISIAKASPPAWEYLPATSAASATTVQNLNDDAPHDVRFTPVSCDCACACESPFDGPLCERPLLCGSIWGVRDGLGEHGITFNANTYQYYQGVASGGIDQVFKYGAHDDYFINVNGEKAGFWEGFFIDLHGESRYGSSVNGDTGAIMPVNTALLFPLPNGDETALTGVKFTQALSEEFITFAGKLNLLDGFLMPFTGARALDGFWNLSMSFPVVVARTVPYSTLGAGACYLQEGAPLATLMVLDTNTTTTTSGFETFFDNGATIFANLTLPTQFFDMPGRQGISGTYSTGRYSDLQPTAYFDPNVGLVVTTGTQQGSWSLFYSADQALYVDPCNPKRTYGVFTNIGTADNGPSPIRFAANVGLYGASPFADRELDTFGIGYAFVEYSSPVKDLAPVLLPVGNDQVVELFYNYAVTPWCIITPDLQIVVPARERTLPPASEAIDTAVVFGVRGKINF